MEDVIIIGGGPAGLSAAIYVQRAGKHAIVFEKSVPGGQIVNALEVENFPAIKKISGADFSQNLFEQASSLGVDVRFEKVNGIKISGKKKFVLTDNGQIQAGAIIIASGAKNRKLGLVNEDKFIGRGVSYCATCDGMFFKNQTVVVVGGGNTALDDSMFLSNYCKKVFVIVRSSVSGQKTVYDQLLKKKNVEFVIGATVSDLSGKDNLEGITISKSDGSKQNIKATGLFVAIGQTPSNDEFKNVLKTDKYGYIEAGEDCKTAVPGIFVAGDNRTKKIRQLTTACSDGTIAALAAIEYLK